MNKGSHHCATEAIGKFSLNKLFHFRLVGFSSNLQGQYIFSTLSQNSISNISAEYRDKRAGLFISPPEEPQSFEKNFIGVQYIEIR